MIGQQAMLLPVAHASRLIGNHLFESLETNFINSRQLIFASQFLLILLLFCLIHSTTTRVEADSMN